MKFLTNPNIGPSLYVMGALGIGIIGGLYRYYILGTGSNMCEFNRSYRRATNWVSQFHANENPDNWYNGSAQCWSTDPMWGLDLMPKRPWEVLKDPSKNFFKLTRDASESVRGKKIWGKYRHDQ